MSNKPTRGIPLTLEEKRAGDAMKPHWWGGIRFNKAPSFAKTKAGNNSPKNQRRGRSDYQGGGGRR